MTTLEELIKAIEAADNLEQVEAKLGIKRRTIYYHLNKWGMRIITDKKMRVVHVNQD